MTRSMFKRRLRKIMIWERKRNKNRVWWDVENCCVPRGFNASNVLRQIKRTMRSIGIRGPYKIGLVAANPGRVSARVLSRLRDSGISVKFVETITDSQRKALGMKKAKKQIADREILRQMRKWRLSTSLPANPFLISGDGGFADEVEMLSNQGFITIVASCDGMTSNELVEASQYYREWRTQVLRFELNNPVVVE